MFSEQYLRFSIHLIYWLGHRQLNWNFCCPTDCLFWKHKIIKILGYVQFKKSLFQASKAVINVNW